MTTSSAAAIPPRKPLPEPAIPTPERHQRLASLFAAALQHPASDRGRYLLDVCGDDEELRVELEALFEFDARADEEGFLRADVIRPTTPQSRQGAEEAAVGRRIGHYEICAWIASGGMGSVYRAVRVDDYRRVVAVKLIRTDLGGLAGRDLFERFTAERQALATLNHPNIASLLDGGTTDDRCPYLVMEYIDGQPIHRYCDQHQQSFAGRVALVRTVCDAVHHTHEHGFIHRDLKPANVLVTTDGRPKLTDFGLVKQLDDDSSLTRTGQLIGSPSYMAPEQAAGRAALIGPATDVYALGAILYELLVGRPPFKGTTWPETVEQVCTQEPVPPRRLQPNVPQDLETICLKCLEKEPARRYATARALGEDLGRFLSGEPIQARPAGRCERLLRWCRRKPLVAALSAALVLVGVGGFAGILSLWLEAEARGTQAVAERNKSARQRDRALHLLNEMTKLAENSLSVEPRMQRVQCDLLEKVLEEYEELARESETASDPELRHKWAQAYYRVAKLSAQLGDNAKALRCYEAAIPIWDVLAAEVPDDSRFLLALFHCQNNVSDIQALTNPARSESARQAAGTAAETLVQRFPDDPLFRDLLASQYNRLARATAGKLDHPQALRQIERAIEVSQELCARHADRPFFRNQLGYCFHSKGAILESAGELGGAAEAYEQALRIKQELCGLNIPELSTHERQVALPVEVAQFRFSLARVQMCTGELAAAEEHLRQSAKTIDELIAAYPALYFIHGLRQNVQRELAELYLATGRTPEAKAAFNRRIEIVRQITRDFPAERVHTGFYLIEAVCFAPQNLLDDRDKHLAMAEELLGEPRNDSDWMYVGGLLYRQGKVRESIAALEKNRQYRDANTCFLLALAYDRARDPGRARQCYDEGVTRQGRLRELSLERLRREAAEALGVRAPGP